MKERWRQAQTSEKAFWEESFGKGEEAFRRMCIALYKPYVDILNKNGYNTDDKIILDIGSGPYGFVSAVNARRKIALDPLMNYFMEKVPDSFYLDNRIFAAIGIGENLLFPKEYFDLICCINTLDHAAEPEKILKEANRCLKPEGYLLLSINHYAWPIVTLRNTLEEFGMGDQCHPRAYHLDMVKEMLSDNGFKIIDFQERNTAEILEKIHEAGGDIFISNTSMRERISRAAKLRGWWYVFKQMIATPFNMLFNKLFKTYPDSIILCRKERQEKEVTNG